MKKRLVQTILSGGNNFGQVSDPGDLMKAQDFMHDRLSGAVHDFVNNSRDAEVVGFSYALGTGTAFSIQIKKPGRIHTKDGLSFELAADTTLTFAPASSTLPRLDMVVAVIEDEVASVPETMPFVRLRTGDEFAASVPPYPPANLQASRELHWRAVVQIKTGTPGPTPSTPVLASNEIPLYIVNVAPNAAQLHEGDVIDLREVMQTLRKINDLASVLQIDVSALTRRVTKLERLIDQPIDLSQVFGEIKTLGAILAELQRQLFATRDVPEIRYDRPKVSSLEDPASSKIVATGGTDASVPYIDMPVGARVNFGDAEVAITPQGFADQSVNPRYVKVGVDTTNVKRVVNLDLASCSQIAADGTVDFLQRAAQFTTPRSRPASAAKNTNLIQIFGGLASNNNSKLGDWYEYDIANDTLTAKTSAGITSLPASDRPAMFSFGDGTHVLLVTASEDISNPKWWKVNTTTYAVTEITTTKPTGLWFFGDLIQAGKIFVVGVRNVSGNYVSDFWEYDTAANTFTQLSTTGSVPDPDLDSGHGCFYENGKFLMVTFGDTVSSGRTYVFDRASLQWTELNIAQPYGGPATIQRPITRFRIANINGRPLLVGGATDRDTDATLAKIWELKRRDTTPSDFANTLEWTPWDATFPPIKDQGFASSLGGTNLPDGKAFLFAGLGRYSNVQPKIYASSQGGLIATTLGGVAGVTIAPSSTYVTFEIASFTAAWAVVAYLGALTGSFVESGAVKLEVSLNNGTNWHVIEPGGRTFKVLDSTTPGVRRLRITLYQRLSRSAVLTKLDEVLDADGPILEDRLAVRYNTPTSGSAKGLYIDRQGIVTLSTTIEPSTPLKALIHKSTPNGTSAPTVKNYINRRRPHLKYTGTKTGSSSSTEFANELAVPVRYSDARVKRASDTNLYGIASPTVTFDAVITVAGVVTNGDVWIVEVEG